MEARGALCWPDEQAALRDPLESVRVIVADGLAAATATIAREAGVSKRSLFTYFGAPAAQAIPFCFKPQVGVPRAQRLNRS